MVRFSLLSLVFFYANFFLLDAQDISTDIRIIKGFASPSSIRFCVMMPAHKSIQLQLIEKGNEALIETKEMVYDDWFCYKDKCAVNIKFEELQANMEYRLQLYEEQTLKKIVDFKTAPKENIIKDFTIITGSCGFTPVKWQKALFPFLNLNIYKPMQQAKAKFMLWLGDTVYYINDNNLGRKVRRNILYREEEKLSQFLETTPQIAMWDDHDFGPNNADGSYIDKTATLAVFNQFWPNPKPVEKNGTYFKISQHDVDFFMLDNRSYSNKSSNAQPTILGESQKQWLTNQLKKSTANFKIICSGNQFIADYLSDKTFALYPKERQEIFDFMIKHQIEGVFFLTGDRHHTEVLKKQVDGLYPMVEYSCSPITSWPNARLNSMRFNKKQRVKGTLINKRNFGKLSFVGDQTNRTCIIETINKKGKHIGRLEIRAEDLKFSK